MRERISRRNLLVTSGALGVGALAGCLGSIRSSDEQNSGETLVSKEGSSFQGRQEVELNAGDAVSIGPGVSEKSKPNPREQLSFNLEYEIELSPRPATNFASYGPVAQILHLPSGKPILLSPALPDGVESRRTNPLRYGGDSVEVPESGTYLLSWHMTPHPYRETVGKITINKGATSNGDDPVSKGDLSSSPEMNLSAAAERVYTPTPREVLGPADPETFLFNTLPEVSWRIFRWATVFGPAHLSLLRSTAKSDMFGVGESEEVTTAIDAGYNRIARTAMGGYLYWELREQVNRIVDVVARAVAAKLGVSDVDRAQSAIKNELSAGIAGTVPLKMSLPEGETTYNGGPVNARVDMEYTGPGSNSFADFTVPLNINVGTASGSDCLYPRGIQIGVLDAEVTVS